MLYLLPDNYQYIIKSVKLKLILTQPNGFDGVLLTLSYLILKSDLYVFQIACYLLFSAFTEFDVCAAL
ncbi:hypothetical protein SPHINGO8BC_50766 [Sphingobacterium multivorum]|uniref:Uncharacterized protein n=1 Tax=Sphingobacterium multivorum TaxID=28454 RepID=A0A654CAK7_SPHMU|nr:hypothetical protein SPHINGO8BC_50766 [Sphingobacterium multivorum]